MKSKSVLRCKYSFSKDIVAIADTSMQFIDEQFYKNKMGEDEEYSGYPVNVCCLRVGWIICDEKTGSLSRNGHRFLQAIQRCNDLEFYTLTSLKIIIEFLYK